MENDFEKPGFPRKEAIIITLKGKKLRFSMIIARKPKGVGGRGQGKVAFSYALWLPLPRKNKRASERRSFFSQAVPVGVA